MNETVRSEVTAVAAATGSKDPEVAMATVAALRGLVEVLEALNVENARAKGWSWEAIAVKLGVTKPWPRCMSNRWRRRLLAHVGLPTGYRGAARPLLEAFGVDSGELRHALVGHLQGVGR